MNIPEDKINQIADLLDYGLRVFYNLKTGEIKDIMVIDNWFDSGLDEKSESVEDARLRYKLIDALYRSKPYRNFKTIIDYSGPYRKEWFIFKKSRFIEWVKEQIDFENRKK